MARKRGISEKSFYAFNPLPTITDAEVLKRAGLDELMEAVKPLPFAVFWKYGGTNETEVVHLDPQEMFMLRESETRDFIRRFAEEGMVILEDPTDVKEVKAKKIAGLTRALAFWMSRGKKKLVELRKLHGYSREDMADYKYDHWCYYANQVKADIISEELKALRAPARPEPVTTDVVQATATKPKRKRSKK